VNGKTLLNVSLSINREITRLGRRAARAAMYFTDVGMWAELIRLGGLM
jgi:hypothetical protein